MIANNLRLGNFLRDSLTKTELIVTELSNDIIKTYVIDRSKFPLPDGWSLEYIPLTEELLIKLGFEYEDNLWHNIISLYPANDGYNYNANYFEYDNLINIKYLHELQNLFYLLVGRELI